MPFVPTTPEGQALYDLATQLLEDHFQTVTPDRKIELLPGELPELPSPLPLPRDSTIVGSMVVAQKAIVIVVRTPHAIASMEGEYFTRLDEVGWRWVCFHRQQDGFRAYEVESYYFCHGESHHGLSIQPTLLKDGILQIKLALALSVPDYRSPCYEVDIAPVHSLFPMLRTPPFVGILHRGITSQIHNDKIFHTSIMLTGNTSVDALQAHYEREMLKQGWVCTDNVASDRMVQSVWTPKNEKYAEWQGIFTISQTHDTEFFLLFHAHYRLPH